MKLRLRSAFGLLLLTILCATVIAQTSRGTLTGTVTDSTGAVVALGTVRGHLMIDLHPSSAKLRDRAVRVLAELTGCDYGSARHQLEASDWNLRSVIDRTKG